MKLHFLSSEKPSAIDAMQKIIAELGNVPPNEADVICPVGGDGFMLETIRKFHHKDKPLFGINQGTVGFMMNEYCSAESDVCQVGDIPSRIAEATAAELQPLVMTAVNAHGEAMQELAFNEVSLLRATRQTARIDIVINGKKRMESMICDGVILATPAGSTAYNLSAHGPILPIDSQLLALTPLSAFRPRRWRGAILSQDAQVEFHIREAERRPVSAVADNMEMRDVVKVAVHTDPATKVKLLFDKGHSLEERILIEQFSY